MNSALPSNRAPSRAPLALCILAVVGFVYGVVILSPHASKHSEAEDIRNCNNILEIWLNKSCERFNVLKRLDDGRVGDQVIHPCKRGLLEITAYVIGGGTLDEARAVMLAKGCTQVWP